MPTKMGVRGRLLIAFFGISGLSVLIALAALYSFGSVGQVLDRVTQTRVPAVVKTIEISRQAERIVAAAPALLAAETKAERSQVSQDIAAEMQVLRSILVSLRDQDPGAAEAALRLEPVVEDLAANLLELDRTVAYRLEASAERQVLLEQLAATDTAIQTVLSPGTMVLGAKFARLRRQAEDGDMTPEARDALLAELTELVSNALPLQTAQFEAGRINDMLVFSALATDPDEIEALAFPLRRSHQNINRLIGQLEPRFRDGLAPQSGILGALISGTESLPTTRVSELAMLADGRDLLARNTALSQDLTDIVNDLVARAEAEITASSNDARERKPLDPR